MRIGEGKHIPQIKDLRRAGYASDFARSLSLSRQTFLRVLFLEYPPIEGQPGSLRTDGKTAPTLEDLAVSRVQKQILKQINRGACMGCIPI